MVVPPPSSVEQPAGEAEPVAPLIITEDAPALRPPDKADDDPPAIAETPFTLLAPIPSEPAPAPDDAQEGPGTLIAEKVIPAANGLVDGSMLLQNAVLRACVLTDPSYVTDRDVMALASAAATIKTMAFGSQFGASITDRLLTEASDTVRSRSALDGIVRGRVRPPANLAELELLDRALMGLPALTVLLRSGEEGGSDIEGLCRMAVLISAKIVETAIVFRTTWQNEALRDSHWTSNPPELADRLRLFDIIQAGITAVDKLDFDVARYDEQQADNNALVFASSDLMQDFLLATIAALERHAGCLVSLAAPGPLGDEATEVLARISSALADAADAIEAGGDIDPTPFGRLRRLYYRELPAAFGFESGAFTTPIGAFATD